MDYTFSRGDTFDIAVSFFNTDGSARDLTDATVYFTCKVSPYDTEPFFQKTITDFGTPTLGVANVTIQPADTSGLTDYAVYVYDVELHEATGQITTTQTGKLFINLDITTV